MRSRHRLRRGYIDASGLADDIRCKLNGLADRFEARLLQLAGQEDDKSAGPGAAGVDNERKERVTVGGITFEVRDPDETSVYVSRRIELMPVPAVQGAAVRRCADCGLEVWVSPSGLLHVDAKKLVVVCEECLQVRTAGKPDDIEMSVAKESVEEAEAILGKRTRK